MTHENAEKMWGYLGKATREEILKDLRDKFDRPLNGDSCKKVLLRF